MLISYAQGVSVEGQFTYLPACLSSPLYVPVGSHPVLARPDGAANVPPLPSCGSNVNIHCVDFVSGFRGQTTERL